jgi:hypothetical protein
MSVAIATGLYGMSCVCLMHFIHSCLLLGGPGNLDHKSPTICNRGPQVYVSPSKQQMRLIHRAAMSVAMDTGAVALAYTYTPLHST